LRMQFSYFVRRCQWSNAMMSVSMTFGKMFIDVLAALPGCERLFFVRMGMGAPIPPSVAEKFSSLKLDG
jgi:hypothetical protein